MPTLINAILCLEPHARGQAALLDAFRYLGSHPGSVQQTLVSLGDEHHVRSDHLEGAFHDSTLQHVAFPHVGHDAPRSRQFAEHHMYPILYSKHPSTNDPGHHHLRSGWSDYCQLNESFASKILETYKPGDIVCVHDYHLCLVPALLREKLPDANIGFFLNTPFPHAEFIRCMIGHDEILSGMLGASTVIFQAESYARSFRAACHKILQHEVHGGSVQCEGRLAHTLSMPIGTDAAAVEEHAFKSPAVARHVAALKRQYSGKKIIVTTDRLDSVRCAPLKLLAFEKLLERHPQWREKLVLVHWVTPTTVEAERDPDEHALASKLSAITQRINVKYGTLLSTPVRYMPQKLSHDEALALLRVSDVGLFTSARDSVSRNSLMYVVCQKENHGPLLLSELSGTASSLDRALLVNPWHLEAVADTMENALSLDEANRKEMQEQNFEHVRKNSVQDWADKLVTHLSSPEPKAERPWKPEIQPLNHDTLHQRGLESNHRLIMLDYDGTLTPIVKEPSAAVPTERLTTVLTKLAANEHNRVWIVSGRDQQFLEKHLGGIPGVGLVAEHGSFMRQPHETQWTDMHKAADSTWRVEAKQILEGFTKTTPGSFVEEKKTSLVWHYRQADETHGEATAKTVHGVLEHKAVNEWRLSVVQGRKTIEIRPTEGSKGAAAAKLMKMRHPDLVFCAGDERTDEDMFNEVNDMWIEERFCCKVRGDGHDTEAAFTLESHEETIKALEVLCERPHSAKA